MNETKKLSVCIFNQENWGECLRVKVGSISITRLEKAMKGKGVKITDVAADAYGLCISTKTNEQSRIIRDFLDAQEKERAGLCA